MRSLWDSFKRSSVCLLCILSNRTLSSAFLVRNGLQSIFGDPLREAVLRFMRIVRMSGLSQVSYAKIPCWVNPQWQTAAAACRWSKLSNHKGSQRHILKSTAKNVAKKPPNTPRWSTVCLPSKVHIGSPEIRIQEQASTPQQWTENKTQTCETCEVSSNAATEDGMEMDSKMARHWTHKI